MKPFKLSAVALLSVALSAANWALDPRHASAADINWDEYMQSVAVVAAMAAAISLVEHCSKKPLLIEEIKSGDNDRTLVFTCTGGEEEEASSILHLQRFGALACVA